MSILQKIQSSLNAPKNMHNKFGNFNYRSCEGILEALKPLLKEHELSVTLSDEIVAVGDRVYVKATASLWSKSGTIASTTAFAREPLAKKGMDDCQITGTASSYARKYALNGLFAIDDTKDSDAEEVKAIADQAQTIDVATQRDYHNRCHSLSMSVEKFCEAMGIEKMADLEVSRMPEAETRFATRKATLEAQDADT